MAHLLLLFYVAVKCGVVSPNPQELIWGKVNKQRAGVGSSGARGGKKEKKTLLLPPFIFRATSHSTNKPTVSQTSYQVFPLNRILFADVNEVQFFDWQQVDGK